MNKQYYFAVHTNPDHTRFAAVGHVSHNARHALRDLARIVSAIAFGHFKLNFIHLANFPFTQQ